MSGKMAGLAQLDRDSGAHVPSGFERRAGPRSEALVFCAWAAALLVGLGMRDPWFPDEPDVAQPAIEMFVTGDWVTPRHNGEPWVHYPPVGYWLSAGLMEAVGTVHPFLLRLPTALASLLLALLVRRMGVRYVGAEASRWASIVLVLFPNYAWQSINVHPDMLFALMQSAGILVYAQGLRETSRRARASSLLAAFALFGLAWLTKGPLGLLMPGLVLSLWHLSLRETKSFLRLAPLALISAAIAGAWYAALSLEHGASWVWAEVNAQNFERFGAAERGHAKPWFYYLERIWLGLAPLSLLLPSAIVLGARETWRDRDLRLLWIWAIAPLVFLSFAVTKREVYLLPSYPAFALLLAARLCETAREGHRWHRYAERGAGWFLVAVGTVACVLPIVVLVMRGLLDSRAATIAAEIWPAVLLIGLAGILAGRATLRNRGSWLCWWSPTTAAVAIAFTLGHLAVLPAVDRYKSYRPMAAWIDQTLPPQAGVALVGPGWADRKECGFLNHLFTKRDLAVLGTLEQTGPYLDAHPGSLVITGEREFLALRDGTTTPNSQMESSRFVIGSRSYWVLRRVVAMPDPGPSATDQTQTPAATDRPT